MLILLGKMRGLAGHPLSYVLRSNLKEPNDANIDDETEDPRLLVTQGALTSQLMTSFAVGPPCSDLTHSQLAASLETLESDGPLSPILLAAMVTIYNFLHACWGKSSWCSHVKKFSKTKNGQQVYKP
jgi:hypothetical protein